MRRNIIAANWKMNLSVNEGVELINKIITKDYLPDLNSSIIFFPAYIHLHTIGEILNHHNYCYSLGSQNLYPDKNKAVTGEVSAYMLSSIGVKYVLIGHNERRSIFSETTDLLVRKVNDALINGITPIFCCGEDKAVRDSGEFFEFIKKQISEVLFHLSADKISEIVIAYEPIWAIGTGIVATLNQVQEVHSYIRETLTIQYDQQTANMIRILYGGSCNAQNVTSLFSSDHVDGFLIGGASLSADSFCKIIENSILKTKVNG
jgi:triosephosphate isomerase